MKNYLFFLSVIALLFFLGTSSAYGENTAIIIRGNGHAPIFMSNENSTKFDFDGDNQTDYYIKAHFTGNENQMYKIDIKVRDSCVNGTTYENDITYESATMKLGFTTLEFDFEKREWLSDGFNVWNPWFRSARSTDANNAIDLVSLPFGALPIPYPETGDDLIQKNPRDKQGSFRHATSMKELDDQDGWEGSFFINPSIEPYFMWSIFPAEGNLNEECDIIAAVGISSEIISRSFTIG